jgi:hypothetical protein
MSYVYGNPSLQRRVFGKKIGCRKVDDQKLLVVTRLKIFNHHKIDDRNPFSITICNEGCPSVNNFFYVCLNRLNKHIKIDIDMTPNIKWSCHVNFDNLD